MRTPKIVHTSNVAQKSLYQLREFFDELVCCKEKVLQLFFGHAHIVSIVQVFYRVIINMLQASENDFTSFRDVETELDVMFNVTKHCSYISVN